MLMLNLYSARFAPITREHPFMAIPERLLTPPVARTLSIAIDTWSIRSLRVLGMICILRKSGCHFARGCDRTISAHRAMLIIVRVLKTSVIVSPSSSKMMHRGNRSVARHKTHLAKPLIYRKLSRFVI